ncbi:MAG: ABC transporter substrate-binding protein [Bdellovibrio sp.]|nr:MAG: ABC transporter substrate-binding protein [Bdellovibrio sp.]
MKIQICLLKNFIYLLSLFSLSSCFLIKDKTPIDAPIVIGEFGSMTGSESTFGTSTHLGIQMAIDEINAKGGLLSGRPLKLISKDDKSSIEETKRVVKELITKHHVVALIGEVASSRTLAAAPIAQRHKVPLISPASTNPKVTQIGSYIFRICYIDPFQGYVMAKFAVENLKIKKIAILKDLNSSYSRDLADYFAKTLKELGGQVVANEVYSSGDINFKSQLKRIRSQKPEAIFIPGYYTEVALIARQIKQMGIKAYLLGGDGWDSKRLFELGKEAVIGGYFSNHYTLESQRPEAIQFRKKFLKKYNTTPDGLAAMGYDALKILAYAIKKAGSTKNTDIRRELSRIKNFPAVTGPITIDENRNAIKPIFIVKVDGPTNRYVTTIQPKILKKREGN